MDWNQLDDHPQFYSALRRAHQTFAERQIEVTAEVFDWYSKCCEEGFLHAEVIKEETSPDRLFAHLLSLN